MSAPTYVRSGRGGAGNFAPKVAPKPIEVEMQSKSSKDLEAQTTTDPTSAADSTSAPSAATPQYKTYARGGAGNWYEPAALKQSGTFTSETASPTTATETPSSPTEVKRGSRVWQGRGGAGNWEADQQIKADEMKRRSMAVKVDEEAALQEITEEAKVEAEKEIQPPQTAHVRVPHLDRHQNLGDEVHDI
ncbi:hypothetical protein Dda_6082 [Drechslerella dactyloides]|uniref:Uncharacterized protein n=1 Tax=Drechslerella dactyloides TaxID=74499 RepID=A0AAD6IV33_DREDA|nr:hypothetical protein Dda_6082 [Drechslerella dactyloides]